MKSEKPYCIGRVVMYVLTDSDNEYQRTFNGNTAKVFPAVIVATWENTGYQNDEVNLKVLADGSVDLWRTSVPHDQESKSPGTWHWPEIK